MQLLGALSTQSNGKAFKVKFNGTDDELALMRAIITEWRGHPNIRNLAVKIITDAGVEARDKKEQALAIADWVQENIYYVHEFPERISTPDRTLKEKTGDCDDMTVLVGSLVESLGIPIIQVCMNINGGYRHVLPAAVINSNKRQKLLCLDPSVKEPLRNVRNPVKYVVDKGKTVSALKLG